MTQAQNLMSAMNNMNLAKCGQCLKNANIIIGFNSEHFDLPLLNKYYPGDLNKLHHLDILKEIRSSYGRRMKLDQLAAGTFGTKKSGHGLEAVTWWRQGEKEKVKKYCLDDVKITKDLYEFALKERKLFFKEGGKKIEVPLDSSNWEKPKSDSDSAMTFTLPF
jgi:uncharacterized protein YprB with RNaseH-like and TPR domain